MPADASQGADGSAADPCLLAFLRHLRVERGLAELTTLKTYNYQVRAYLAFLRARGRDAGTATRDDVLAFLEAKRNAGQRTSSLFGTAIAVRQFHRYLAAAEMAPADPTAGMRLPKFKQRLPEPFSIEEMQRLLAVPTGTAFHRIRMFAALSLMWAVGARVSEVTGLRKEQLNLKDGWLRLRSKGGGERVAPLGPQTTKALLAYLAIREGRPGADSQLLFLSKRGRAWTRGAFWAQVKQLAREAGVAGRCFPHRVRHSTISHLLWAGVGTRILQELAGHVNERSLARYAHVLPEHLKQACQNAHPRF